jgi:hypothetical protein
MNVRNQEGESKSMAVESKGDSAKLLSLLALATSAVAMPQSSNADIVFTDLSANPVHVGPQANASYIISFPGTAQIGFHTHTRQTFLSLTSTRWITGRQEGGYVRLRTNVSFFVRANAGQKWATGGGVVTSNGFVGYAKPGSTFPPAFNDKYFLFEFKDSTQPGSPVCFGWIEVSLAISAGNTGQPDLAIQGYAYDTSGAQLSAGQVPEPSAPALLALGAMALGAKGLRSWRKNRQSAPGA